MHERRCSRFSSDWRGWEVYPASQIKALVRNSIPAGWRMKRCLWPVATDYQTGERVTFGAPGAPAASAALWAAEQEPEEADARAAGIPTTRWFPAIPGGALETPLS